ncbi:tRNA (adenine(22)-N(1))-methyltransferase TrmK [Marinobacterium sp. AK62]|uniref:tRNA (Adenine(22)-N(1))-methyltransferase TrmK n=2 Tax=Marinobacterium alkalitolerans TaxID=1542925 RepID=A0ABS3ZAC0_9GAMM|nr:tRNA (adenine(22)-N(1))-methyltransferase TrmK [Marinobacterium alkalitolerans]
MASGNYDHIWDCCCDHGYLGRTLLRPDQRTHIHFVDIVPALIEALNQKLPALAPEQNWSTHCCDVAELPLQQYPGRHLVIIAGVGGDLMTEFVRTLHSRHPDVHLDLLLCPVYHQFKLRQHLRSLGFRREREALIKENGKFYEILKVQSPVCAHPDLPEVSLTGDCIWNASTVEQAQNARDYLQRKLRHYERMLKGQPSQIKPVLAAYRSVEIA